MLKTSPWAFGCAIRASMAPTTSPTQVKDRRWVGLTGQGQSHEARDHHPLLAGLAGTDGVEEARDDSGEPLLLVVGAREELGARPPSRRSSPAGLRRQELRALLGRGRALLLLPPDLYHRIHALNSNSRRTCSKLTKLCCQTPRPGPSLLVTDLPLVSLPPRQPPCKSRSA